MVMKVCESPRRTSSAVVGRAFTDGGIELPLDFDAEEAEEIAEELRAAAEVAREIASGAKPKKKR